MPGLLGSLRFEAVVLECTISSPSTDSGCLELDADGSNLGTPKDWVVKQLNMLNTTKFHGFLDSWA